MIAGVCFILLLNLSLVLATNSTCPTWQYHRNSPEQCECGSGLFCRDHGIVEIEEGNCATAAGPEDHYYYGMCVFTQRVNNTNRLFSEMPGDPDMLEDVVCGPYNRKGLLCGECFEGFGPAIYSLDLKCENCSQLSTAVAVVSYLLLELVPITLFFIFIIFFRLDITSGPLLGYFIFCQLIFFVAEGNSPTFYIYFNMSLEYHILLYISLSLCRFWTMHWFFQGIIPPFCLSQYLRGVHVQLLRLVPINFLVVLVILILILVELHSRESRLFCKLHACLSLILRKTNFTTDALFHAFATFIFLSHGSVYFVTTSLLVTLPAHNYNGSLYKGTVAIDPTIEWLSMEHVKYIIIAAVPFTLLTLTPSVLLVIYPTKVYRCLSQYISAKKRLAITAFAEALHSCFKDGLNGTRDYRVLAGVIPFLIIPYSVVMLTFHVCGYGQDIAGAFFSTVVSFIVLSLRPCKSTISNISLSFHLLMYAFLAIVSRLWNYELNVDTETLALTIIFILLLSHFLVFLWVGYKIVICIMPYIYRCNEWRIALADLANSAKKFICCRRYHGYQELY